MIPDDVRSLLDRYITSVWALELVLLMRKQRERGWRVRELVTELRASEQVIIGGLPMLLAAELVSESEAGVFRYNPARADLEETVANLERVYREFPVTIVRHIALAPNRGLTEFANAFKFRKD